MLAQAAFVRGLIRRQMGTPLPPRTNLDRLRKQTTLARFGELALKSDNLDEILTEACRLIAEALGTDLAKVMELQPDGEALLVRAGVGWKPGIVGELTIRATEKTSEGLALRTGKPMISPDIATETRFTYADFLVDNGVHAVANVVILGGEGKPPFGILQIDSRVPRNFNDGDTDFLRSYANLLAAAVLRLRVLGEMRDGQQRLRLAMAAGRLGSLEFDLATGIMTNTERVWDMFGYADPVPAWTYTEFLEHVLEEDRALVDGAFRKAMESGIEWHFECRIRRVDDQSIRWLESRGTAVAGRSSARPTSLATHLLGIIADITARKALEEDLRDRITLGSQELAEAADVRDEAERANRAKSRFLASMSHELRTPLNGVLGYANLLNMEGGLNTLQAARVDSMLGAGTHLLEMINRVLDFSEIDAGDTAIHSAELDIAGLAAECIDFIRPVAAAKGLRILCSVAPEVPASVTTDPTRLRQILVNLVGNAVKYTSSGSVELRLRLSPDGTALRLEVADTGPGIPAEHRHRLFHDFERIDSGSNTAEGAGLGLAISNRLAILLGSQLTYDDIPTGGSLFWLDLKLAEEPPAGPTARMVPVVAGDLTVPAQEAPSDRLRILVADDSEVNLDVAAAFLKAAGHETICVKGGLEAVEAAVASDFDVVLMDVRMPVVDGLEATRRIRRLSGARGKVPIVALTAQAFGDQVAACRLAGMDDHLAKPFSPESLAIAVAHAAHSERS